MRALLLISLLLSGCMAQQHKAPAFTSAQCIETATEFTCSTF